MSDFSLDDLFKPRERTFDDLPDHGGATFTAQFDSTCSNCGGTLQEGQPGRFEGDDAVHVECPPKRSACPRCWLVHGTHQEECE